MTTCASIRPSLSEYIDRHLDAVRTDEIRAHLSICAECRGLADDLDRVRGVARHMGPMTPPAHLWLEIAGRAHMGEAGAVAAPRVAAVAAPPRLRGEVVQWLGLAAALVVVTLGVYAVAQPDPAVTPAPAVDTSNATDVPTVETVEETMRRAEAEYERAIAQLELIVKSGNTSVSPATVATLQKNLPMIDSAIAESRAALTDSPDSQPARTSLFEALRNKVNLLQHTVVLMNEMRKGDASGAAEVAAGFGKTS
jgi:hypothetical protein